MNFTLTKLTTTFIAVLIIVAGFFTYSALGGTAINVTINTGSDLEDGLVGHWTFDGKDMIDVVADISGQGTDGYIIGQTSTTTAIGIMGQTLDCDGVNDYIELGAYD